jgi:penicillin-binding protein 1B
VRKQLQRDYDEKDLRSEGLLIFTAMDPVIQIQAENVLKSRIEKLEKSRRMKKDKLNGAMVVSSVQGAEILAVVGGRDARFAGYNRALNASRQIGSLIKPVVYLAALEAKQYNLATPIDSGPVTVRLSKTKIWEPKNYSGKDQGMVSFEQALVHSINTPTVRIGITMGLDKVINELQVLGLQKELQPNPSLLLGALELSPMEVQQIYQTIAAGGTYTPLTAIRSVMNSYGKSLKRYPLQVKQVVSEESVYLLSHAMNKITKEGTAQYLKHALPAWKNAAGKTGTTNKNVDSWFAGFTGQHVASVWVGRDDNKPTGFTGSAGALRVWGDLMKVIPTKPFKPKRPRNVKFFKVNSMTGLLHNPSCGKGEILPFVNGTEPDKIYECPPPEMFIGADGPSWGQDFQQGVQPNPENSGAQAATIWNNNKRVDQPNKQQVKPQAKPKVERDSGIWIDKLMQR